MSPRSRLGRSFDVYYRDHARTERMDRLNAQFVPAGGLAFDIGAHVGDRTGSFLRLGASVVAVEPQAQLFRALRLIYGRNERVSLHRSALGAKTGTLELYINQENPTVSTASQDLISAAATAAEWQGQVWDDRVSVPVTTLDDLIRNHGQPDFVKIDVEGFEEEVLRGLTTPVQNLSFEFTTIQRAVALGSIDQLERLAPHAYNLSLGEDHRLRYPNWIDASEMRTALKALPDSANSGDVFARPMG